MAARMTTVEAKRLAVALGRRRSLSVTISSSGAGGPEALLPYWGTHPAARNARRALHAHAAEGRAARIPTCGNAAAVRPASPRYVPIGDG
jgi:hypothetical protein